MCKRSMALRGWIKVMENLISSFKKRLFFGVTVEDQGACLDLPLPQRGMLDTRKAGKLGKENKGGDII